jgi:hypothetical protein
MSIVLWFRKNPEETGVIDLFSTSSCTQIMQKAENEMIRKLKNRHSI